MEDGSGGDDADARMPDDVGDEIKDNGDLVRIEGPIEHPSDAKGVRNEYSPVNVLLLEDQGYVLTQNDLHLFILFVGSGEYAWLAFGDRSWPEIIASWLFRCEDANSFPDTVCKATTEDGKEGWGDRAGDNEDDGQDLSAGDGD